MGRENLLALVATIAHGSIRGKDWETAFDEAMNAAATNGIITDEDLQFQGAVGGLLMWAHKREDDELTERITKELGVLRALSAALSGVVIDTGQLTLENPLGLMKRWKERTPSQV